MLRRIGKVYLIHATVFGEASKYKGIVQKLKLGTIKPIPREASGAKRVDLKLERVRVLPLSELCLSGSNSPIDPVIQLGTRRQPRRARRITIWTWRPEKL